MLPVTICHNLSVINESIRSLEIRCSRPSHSVKLIAVSKKKSAEAIREAWHCGQKMFGESYAQEFQRKAESLADLAIEWHFIGPIQSNKTRLIAAHAHWVHSIDRLKIASRLAAQRPEDMPDMNVCIEVNINNEPGKSGIPLDEVADLARAIDSLKNLRLRGLMCIPQHSASKAAQHAAFSRLRSMMEQLNEGDFSLDTLSMGMSGDYPVAIEEGATMIRVGTAIFGERR